MFKKKPLIYIIAGLLLIGLVALGIFIKSELDARERVREREESEREAIDQIVLPILEEYGVIDAALRPLELDSSNTYVKCDYDSEQFAALSDDDKLAALIDIQTILFRNKEIFPNSSKFYNTGAEVRIICGECSYEHTLEGNDSGLLVRKNGNSQIAATCESEIAKMMRDYYDYISSRGSGSGNSGDATICSNCDGTGRVTKHFGNYWSKQEGYGYGDVCTKCGGTGYVSD